MSNRDFSGDLLVRFRRGALSDDEDAELRQTLATSVEARLLLAAGQGFDAEAAVEAGDDELIRRVARRAERAPSRRQPPKRVRYFVQGALAGALLTGLAIAGGHLLVEHWGQQRAVTAPAPPASLRPPVRKLGLAPRADTTAATPVAPETEPPLPPNAADTADQPRDARPVQRPREATPNPNSASVSTGSAQPATADFADPPTSKLKTAPELFGAANRARVRGDVNAAIALYRELETKYPATAETTAAHLSLGVLYLQQHQAAAALAELRQRRAAGSGVSDAEALWSEALALRELGRTSEERAALERLVASFPASAYMAAARKRLAELH